MNLDKFTVKAQEALSEAQMVAQEYDQQQLDRVDDVLVPNEERVRSIDDGRVVVGPTVRINVRARVCLRLPTLTRDELRCGHVHPDAVTVMEPVGLQEFEDRV